jgi:hypothetical protein
MPRRSLLLNLHGSSGRSEAEPPTCTICPGKGVVALMRARTPNGERWLVCGVKALLPQCMLVATAEVDASAQG